MTRQRFLCRCWLNQQTGFTLLLIRSQLAFNSEENKRGPRLNIQGLLVRPSTRITAAILSLLMVAGCGVVGNSGSSSAGNQETFISECGYGYAQKPSQITLTCGDGGMYIDEIEYSSWDNNSASATGIFFSNDCDPDCASGSLISNPVKIKISGTKQDANGTVIFTDLAITAENELFNGTKKATFDIGIEPEDTGDAGAQEENEFSSSSPEEKTIDLIGRLNLNEDLWQINEAASSSYGKLARRQLGLYTDPDYVIECNLNYSGTWLFIYSNESDAYEAFNSNYFFRNSNYSAELVYDPVTNLIVILHTSVGGKKQCLDSAFEQLTYYATD